MSSLFSYLFSSSHTPASTLDTRMEVSPSLAPTVTASSSSETDEFVLVDDDCDAAVEDPHQLDMDSIMQSTNTQAQVPSLTTSSRSCRLYATSAPKNRSCRPLVSASSAAPAPSSSFVNQKRSFASVLKESNPSSAVSSTPSSPLISYAQDADAIKREQLLAKLDHLDSFSTAQPQDESIEAMLDSINYNSPPLESSKPLSAQSRLLYECSTEWMLDASEPDSHRSKRASASISSSGYNAGSMFAAKQPKGKSKSEARVEEKAMRKARGFKTSY